MIEVLYRDRDNKLSGKHLQYITKRVIYKLNILSLHQYGCRVIQKVMHHEQNIKEHKNIINFIVYNIDNFHQFINDQYGNYLIQSIMEFNGT